MERQVEMLLRGGQFKELLENYIRGLKEKYGLKRAEVEVLYYLSRSFEYNTAKDIAASLHMNKGHVSQTTEALSLKGYIAASRDGKDYRIVHYTVTQDAKLVTEEIDKAVDRLYKALFDGISDDEMEMLKRIAAQIASNINSILRSGD